MDSEYHVSERIPPPSSSSENNNNQEPIFLHGELDVRILEAKSLPNMDLVSENMRRCFTICGGPCNSPYGKRQVTRTRMQQQRPSKRHPINTSDPYVSICLAGSTVAQTRVITNCENPIWDEHFCVQVAHPVVKVEFHVKDNDVLGAELIGVVEIPVNKILSGDSINDWFPVIGHSLNFLKSYPELHISMQYKPVGENSLYNEGVGSGPDYAGVPNTYFPLRKGGFVTLYQDAHVPPNHRAIPPEIVLDNGNVYEQKGCWEDMCHAILEAHHLIYIAGWSIYHKVKLVREPTKPLPSGGELTLGELLKYKSQEGVRVVLLLWDDKTSHDKFYLKTDGLMQTHDEETKRYFKHSSVHCVLAPRYGSNKLSIFKQQVVGTLFTHHQKCVVLDSQASGSNRKITAFIGGLDLCDGRYDTPEHRLFRDLDSVFANDFHNPTFPVSAFRVKQIIEWFQCSDSMFDGLSIAIYDIILTTIELLLSKQPDAVGFPRQPWHDLHCKIDGPAAYDILTNFEQRWRKAAKWRDFKLKKVTRWNDDALLRLDRISWILKPSSSGPDGDECVRVADEQDPECWHVQVFRSIDSGSVKGFPKVFQEAVAQNLVCGKNLKVDKSIHTAYVKAIRSAQHFIYIENQYFLGSSYCWPSYKNAGADNLIPMELTLKVASKIKAREHFSVYIILPMWPEGVPTSAAMQEILFWQGQTMAMMYNIIAKELEKVGLSEQYHPQDYLNFYCLGKREEDSCLENHQMENRALASVQKFQRFMIYVHAKGMVVDDEYVIMGSANINQRSLDGSRDTEIAMGAYQPTYTWAKKNSHPRGQVYGYRMSLWAEHLGFLEEAFCEPQLFECMKLVNEISRHNWKAYVSEHSKEMRGHLLQYPIEVSRSGKVSALPGHETFPDVGGKVLGSPSTLPDALTT